jgi:hypothetical protein
VREENQSDSQVPVVIQIVTEFLDLRLEKFVRDLRHHPSAVAGLGVRVHGSPVGEGTQRLERVLQHLIGAFAADLSNEANAAGVVLLGWGIQGAITLCGVE